MSIAFANYPPPDKEEALKEVRGQKIKRALDQAGDHNQIEKIQVNLDGFEIFICELEELFRSTNFKVVRKKNMILPVSIVFIRSTHLVLNKDRKELIKSTHNKLSIEKLVLRLSYQDFLLVTNSINFQIEQLKLAKAPVDSPNKRKDQLAPEPKPGSLEISQVDGALSSDSKGKKKGFFQKLEEAEEEKDDAEEISPLKRKVRFDAPDLSPTKKPDEKKTEIIIIQDVEAEANDEEWEPDHEEFSIISQGIQLVFMFFSFLTLKVLINDAQGILAPALELTLYEMRTEIIKLQKKLRISGRLIVSLSYFNPHPSKWEPIIEKIGLDVEVIQEENPKLTLSISNLDEYDEMNINISDSMVRHTKDLFNYASYQFCITQ